MKRKISRSICLMLLTALTATVLGFFGISAFQGIRDAREHVCEQAMRLAAYINMTDGVIDDTRIIGELSEYSDETRFTLIAADGEVLYDNMADIGMMDNHIDRPEVDSALKNGTGESERRSQTIDKNIYYYAVKLDNGSVVRAAETNISLSGMAITLIPELVAIILIVCVAALFIARRMTKNIMQPINEIDINNIGHTEIYDEIKPFIERIKKDNEEREHTERIRREFSANVSHELKTPLTTISGYAQMIHNGMARPEDMSLFGGKIEKEADRLILLINDIINLSRLDETDVIAMPERVDLSEIANQVVSDLINQASRHKVNVYFGGSCVEVIANRTLLYQMIYNVVDNAIKYNKEDGEVVITTNPLEEGAAISVKDTGIGIAAEDQERVFERFYRVDKSHSKTIGGTGLGLSIVKHTALIHKAQIRMESELGKGTEITIVFPIAG